MDQFPPVNGTNDAGQAHQHDPNEWTEALVRTVAHLAAQLTLNQIRLRALATELQEQGVLDQGAVASRVRAIATAEGGGYLRENLGDALVEVIDVETLEHDLVAFLEESGAG